MKKKHDLNIKRYLKINSKKDLDYYFQVHIAMLMLCSEW